MKSILIIISLSFSAIAAGQVTVEPVRVKQSDLDAVLKSCVSSDDLNKVDLYISTLSGVNLIGALNIRRKEGVTDLVNINLAPLFEKKSNFLVISNLRLEGVRVIISNQEVEPERKSMSIGNIEITNSEISDWECFKDCDADSITIGTSKVTPINAEDKFKFKKIRFIGDISAEIKSSFEALQTKE